MKTRFILLFFLFSSHWLSAQKTIKNSFVILENTSAYTQEFITSSVLKANFETYRLKDKRVAITCDNGFRLELLSAKELFIAGETIDAEKYAVSGSAPAAPVFTLQENGYFVNNVNFIANPKKKSIKK